MKSLLILISVIICLLLNHKKNKSIFNLVGIFLMFWGGFGFLSSLSLYGLNEISYTTTFLIVGAMYAFTIVGLAFPSVNKVNIDWEKLKEDYSNKEALSSHKLITFLNLAAYAFSIPYLIKAVGVIQNYGFEVLRTYAFVGSEQFASTKVLTLFQYVISPLFVATMIVTAMDISMKRKATRGIIMTVVGTSLYTVLFGGRYLLFQTLIVFISAFYLNYTGTIRSFLKRNKKLLVFVLILVVGMAIITSLRPSGGMIRSIYLYFSGPFAYLDVLLRDTAFTKMGLNGIATFGFIHDFILYILVFLVGVSPYYGASYQITQVTGKARVIGDGITFNSLGTMYTAFIPDFGIYFSLIGVFIFAIILCVVEKRFSKKPSLFRYSVYLYAIYVVVNAVLSYSLLKFSSLILILYLALFTGAVKIKFGNRIRLN